MSVFFRILDYLFIFELYFRFLVFLRYKFNFLIFRKIDYSFIISLTSYPERFDNLDYTIKCLLTQKLLPFKIILWIFTKDYKKLPNKVIKLQSNIFEIKKINLDLKSYKKLIPCMKIFPKKNILTADDDVYYPYLWSQHILKNNINNKIIYGHRGHKITFNQNKINPYSKWIHNYKSNNASKNILLTGVGGILYPSDSLFKDFSKIKIFLKKCYGDDIWFYFMGRLNNNKFKILNYYKNFYIWKNLRNSQISPNLIHNKLNDLSIKYLNLKYKIFKI